MDMSAPIRVGSAAAGRPGHPYPHNLCAPTANSHAPAPEDRRRKIAGQPAVTLEEVALYMI
jgi:hypothetical protein